MSRDKKKIIADICPFYKEYGTCDQCNKELAVDDEPCYWEYVANAIVNNGYAKASEVAREIFEEISKASVAWGCYCITTSKAGFLTEDVNRTLAELKKEYTESENDNG